MADNRTTYIRQCLGRLRLGDTSVAGELIQVASERLAELTRVMFRDYPRVRRWEETDDVLQNAMVRLHRALQSILPETPRDFYRLATVQIRRELIDMARHYYGPARRVLHDETNSIIADVGSNGATSREPAVSTYNPERLSAWTDFHQSVEKLPDEEREVFELIWYQDLKQTEAAELLGVAPRTVMRRWQRACLGLHKTLSGILPGS